MLDLLEKDNTGNLRDVTELCQQFHTDVEQWQTSQLTYLAPAINEACDIVRAARLQRPDNNLAGAGGPRFSKPEAASPSFSMPQSLPANFPLRDDSKDFRDTENGLPKRRSDHNKSEMWREVYEADIPLPSSYDPALYEHPPMKRLCDLEFDFRRIAADRALGDVRAAIIGRAVIKTKESSQKKKVSEHVQGRIGRATSEINKLADRYRRHWVVLRVLGMQETEPQFRRLKYEDTVNLDVSTADNTLGQSKQPVPWIWGDFNFAGSESDPRYRDFYDDGKQDVACSVTCCSYGLARRVHWFRSSAFCTRWSEEVQLLKEEMRRTLRFHAYKRDQWVAHTRDGESASPGAAAYARK